MQTILKFTDMQVLHFFKTKFENVRHITGLSTTNHHKVNNSQKQSIIWPTLYNKKNIKTKQGLTALYDVLSGNTVCLFLQLKGPHWASINGLSGLYQTKTYDGLNFICSVN